MSRSLFMLVHSALMFTNTTCDINNALVNAEINMKINKYCGNIVLYYLCYVYMLTNLIN